MKNGFLRQAELFVFLALFLAMALVCTNSGKLPPEPLPPKPVPPPPVPPAPAPQPPIIRLSEDDPSFRFAPLSAEVPPAFVAALTRPGGIIDILDASSRQFRCDTIEIVGHTDEQHIDSGSRAGRRQAAFDRLLIPGFQADRLSELIPSSNVDLGMLRALAVVKILHAAHGDTADPRLRAIQHFLPYSAGQMIDLNYRIPAQDSGQRDDSRRRIEIRLLRSPRGNGAASEE